MNRDEIAREDFKERKGKKRILIYGAQCDHTTGNSKLIYHMAKSFQAEGHTVFTIGIEYNDYSKSYNGVPILPSFFCETCGHSKKGSNEGVQKIANWLNTLQVDYFICVGDPYHYQQMGIGKMSFDKMEHTKALLYATIDSEGMLCNQMLELAGKPDYLDVCDAVIATAKYTQEQMKEWRNIDCELVYEAIDLDLIYVPVTSERKTELRKKYRFKENDFIIYAGGRNLMRKRHNDLIDAAAKLITETENTYLYLNIPSGEGLAFPDIMNPLDFIQRVLKHKYGRDLITEGRISFVGRSGLGDAGISERQNAELYQIADVYATTTGGEGFGLMPVEAQACGIPVIVPDNSTGWETIGGERGHKNTQLGFSFAKGGLLLETPIELWQDLGIKQYLTTPAFCYNAIKYLHNDPELRTALGKGGREYVEKHFNLANFRKRWKEVIENTQKKKREEFKQLEIPAEEKKEDS
jgi:glycosyltransferase involved in cell wall biosynthesis